MMAVHIDWLSIVDWLPLDLTDGSGMRRMLECSNALADADPFFIDFFGWPMSYGIVKSRPPYSLARRSDDSTRTLYVHPMASHFLFEVAGSFCTQHPEMVEDTAKRWAGKLSRLDVAVDFQTDVKPTEFAATIGETTVKTRSEFISSTGQTVYRGSRSSDRFMRVYRYNEPHPRAHLLRVEFQLKRLYANALANRLKDGATLPQLAAGLGDHFGLNHPIWNMLDEPVHLKVASNARQGSTVFWLTNIVAPLMVRMQRDGTLDVRQWFNDYVRDKF